MNRILFIAVVTTLLPGCSQSKYCPDAFRMAHINSALTDLSDRPLRVDDCLREYATRMAKGPSSGEEIVKAGIGYCGTYDDPVIGEPEPGSVEREQRDLMSYVVAARTYQCPMPRDRDDTSGNLKDASWLPDFMRF